MANFLIVAGFVGAILMIISLLILGIMLVNTRQWWGAFGCLAGMATIVFLAILGDMYVTGWWNK